MNRRFFISAAIVIAVIVALAAAFVSSHPDGLEWVAEKLGFVSKAAQEDLISAPMPDYSLGGIKSPFWSTVLAGTAGAVITFFSAWIIAKILRKKAL